MHCLAIQRAGCARKLRQQARECLNRLVVRFTDDHNLNAHDLDPTEQVPSRGGTPEIDPRVVRENRFKQINDTFGHAAGDALLTVVGERLAQWCTDHGGFAGRLGGDEFAAVVHIDDERANDHITDLSRRLSEPVQLGHRAVVPHASIGICRPADRPGAPLGERLRAADEAMYTAKSLGSWWRPASRHNTYATANGRRVGRPGTRHAAPTQ
ncbi:GGDEF domain-containing protein [Streptomyces sp. NPDC059544]|uniref:GGDEF domain-containing protein n=1 Tax=Streptomyces sp. NPDC059544 TaxID=3346861 RepID=UPI0036BD03EA